MTRINKVVVFTTVLTLAFTLVALALTGCGNEMSKAKDLTGDANEKISEMNATIGDLGKQLATLFSAGAGDAADKTKFDTAEKELEAQVDQTSKDIASMRSDYEQVKKLKDVDKYKEYADVQLQVLDLTKKSMDSVNNFLKEVGKLKAASPFDKNAFAEAFGKLRQELSDQSAKSTPLVEQAQKLNNQNKLI